MTKFQARLQELGFSTYEDYLNSPHWFQFRARYRKSDRIQVCMVCAVEQVELHHRTYVRLGCELFEDVVPLCRTHHEAVHEWLKSSGRQFVTYTHEALEALGVQPTKARVGGPKHPEKKKKKGSSEQQKKARHNPCRGCPNPAKRGQVFCRRCQKGNTTPMSDKEIMEQRRQEQRNAERVAAIQKKQAFVEKLATPPVFRARVKPFAVNHVPTVGISEPGYYKPRPLHEEKRHKPLKQGKCRHCPNMAKMGSWVCRPCQKASRE